jgi:C1A family cysteine protease
MKTLLISLSFPVFSLPVQNRFSNTSLPVSHKVISHLEKGVRKLFLDTVEYFNPGVTSLPPAIILDMPVPGNQGKQRSCGAWAVVYGAGNYFMHITKGRPYNDSLNLNPAFIYDQLFKGTGGITALTDNLKLFKEIGSCPLKAMPYNLNNYNTQPDSLQCAEAKNYKINGWLKIDPYNLTEVKTALAGSKPVIFSIKIDEGFDRIKAPFVWKERRGRQEDVHTMVISGYDDDRKAFRVMNSWGTAWGDKGFIWIDYDFFLNNALTNSYILI